MKITGYFSLTKFSNTRAYITYTGSEALSSQVSIHYSKTFWASLRHSHFDHREHKDKFTSTYEYFVVKSGNPWHV